MVTAAYPEDTLQETEASRAHQGARHIAINGLTKRYAGQSTDALHAVSLTIAQGEIFGIIGRSGAGKSSLIRCLNRLESPTAGEVLIHDVDIGTLSPQALVRWRRGTGMIFQHFNLLSAKTVRENIELPLKVAGVSSALRRKKADELLALVGLTGRENAWPAQLSGGQKQRVGIARALVHDPELLLCDEATSALDPETTRAILDLLREINRQKGITIVLITHEMDVIHALCDKVAVLEQGKIIEQGPVWHVFGDPQHPTTRQLLLPHRDDLPPFLAEKLTDAPVNARSRPLIALNYTGSGEPPAFSSLTAVLGDDVTLVQSALEWIQQRQVGRMLLLASPSSAPLNVAETGYLLADRVEVLGYVTEH